MFRYKIDVLAALKEKGYTTYSLTKDKGISPLTIQNLRENKIVGIKSLEVLCRLLACQPGDIIEYVKED